MLLSHKGSVVTYDQLGDEVWGVDAEYSLWALSRLVGRVKTKLRREGYGDLIENVRSVGYQMVGIGGVGSVV